MTIGNKIIHYRRCACMTQDSLAFVLKVSLATISRWERGVSKPSNMAMKTLIKKGVLPCHSN